jgi:hypothetical protein
MVCSQVEVEDPADGAAPAGLRKCPTRPGHTPLATALEDPASPAKPLGQRVCGAGA